MSALRCRSQIGSHIAGLQRSNIGSHILLVIQVIMEQDEMTNGMGHPKDIPFHGTSHGIPYHTRGGMGSKALILSHTIPHLSGHYSSYLTFSNNTLESYRFPILKQLHPCLQT